MTTEHDQLIRDARSIMACRYQQPPGESVTLYGIELAALKKLWEGQGREPVAKIVQIRTGQISMFAQDGNYFDLTLFVGKELFTRPTTQVELDAIGAEYLEKAADAMDFKGSISSSAAGHLRSTAAQLKGERK